MIDEEKLKICELLFRGFGQNIMDSIETPEDMEEWLKNIKNCCVMLLDKTLTEKEKEVFLKRMEMIVNE